MRNLLAVYFVFLFHIFNSIQAQDYSLDIEKHLSTLASDEMQGRETGTVGLEKSAEYIENYFKSENIKPYYESYKDTFYLKNKKTAYNIIAYLKGSDTLLANNPVIIGAHYDHIGYGRAIKGDTIANGANDNASGTVAVMQLAKLLKSKKSLRPIIFVLFDAEEQGLVGSKYLAEKLKSEGIAPYVVFNIEMIGVQLLDTPDSAYLTGFEKSNFAEIFNSYLPEDNLIFSPQSKKYKLFKRSDNHPFYKSFNIPAHTASTFDFTNYDFYHHVDDEADKMNFEHINNLASEWAKALSKIANHKDKLIKMK
jgi:Zn-dependent M28 family amino/carboxypeptidase